MQYGFSSIHVYAGGTIVNRPAFKQYYTNYKCVLLMEYMYMFYYIVGPTPWNAVIMYMWVHVHVHAMYYSLLNVNAIIMMDDYSDLKWWNRSLKARIHSATCCKWFSFDLLVQHVAWNRTLVYFCATLCTMYGVLNM